MTDNHLRPVSLSRRWHYAREQAISFLMQQAVENPQVISLAAGLVDFETLPVHEALAGVQELLADKDRARHALQYGTTPGADDARRAVLQHFARQEGRTPDQLGFDTARVVLTTGSQQLLSLACEVLLDPGDICLVADPTYFVFLGNLQGVGAEAVGVAADDDGMRTDALEAALRQLEAAGKLERVKLIYVVSYYDNPRGVSMSGQRRREVVDIARRWSRTQRILILEDAAYRELRYDGPALPSVWSCDPTGEHVIYTQTFSKSFSPGLRVGFGILPQDVIGPVCDRKGNEDFGSANFNQRLIGKVLESGGFEQHLQEVCRNYVRKRDAMLEAAEEHFSSIPGAAWVHPAGGLYVWMTLPEALDTGFNGRLFEEAVKRAGVMYVPGGLFYAAGSPRNQMRLSFGVQTPDGIREGMRRLAGAVRAVT
ncbi:MAG: PLP-dependent aminotransferase family protein [Planctomycetaceae bacterium]|nr:PLP-dependent aminotransferase family protein [Planctomycetaceae bacterium]